MTERRSSNNGCEFRSSLPRLVKPFINCPENLRQRPNPIQALAITSENVVATQAETKVIMELFVKGPSGEIFPSGDLDIDSPIDRNIIQREVDRVKLKSLTNREQEVLTQLSGDRTNMEIAWELGIGAGTVKSHIENIIGKLGVRSRIGAVVVAVRSGVLNDYDQEVYGK